MDKKGQKSEWTRVSHAVRSLSGKPEALAFCENGRGFTDNLTDSATRILDMHASKGVKVEVSDADLARGRVRIIVDGVPRLYVSTIQFDPNNGYQVIAMREAASDVTGRTKEQRKLAAIIAVGLTGWGKKPTEARSWKRASESEREGDVAEFLKDQLPDCEKKKRFEFKCLEAGGMVAFYPEPKELAAAVPEVVAQLNEQYDVN